MPIADGLAFEDYRIDFGENAQLSQVVLSDDCFVTENTVPVPLVDDRYLPLQHGLFDKDAEKPCDREQKRLPEDSGGL